MMNQTYEILSALSPSKKSGGQDGDASGYGASDASRLMPSNQMKTNVMKPLRLDHLIQREKRLGHSGKP